MSENSDSQNGKWSSVIAIVSLSAFALAWALSSPPLSTPDEKWHLANIWCAPAASDDDCIELEFDESSGFFKGRPRFYPSHCFFRNATIPANCADSEPYSRSAQVLRQTTYYLPGFPVVLNRFVSSDGSQSVLLMKLFNSFLFVWITSVILLRAPSRIAQASITATSVTLVPFSIWLVTSINPSSWGITGIGGLWALLIAVRNLWTSSSRAQDFAMKHLGILGAFVVSIVISLQTRSDIVVFGLVVVGSLVFFEVILPLIMKMSSRSRGKAIVIGISVSLMALGVAADRGVLGYAFGSELKALNPDGPTVSVWFTNWLTHFPAVFLDAYGAAGLGENDVGISKLVMIVSLVVLGGVAMFASQHGSIRQLSSAVLLAFSFVAILWFASIELDLYNVPGRYVMPLFPVIIGTYVYYSRSSVQFFDVLRLRYIAIGLLGIANALGLYAVIERYSAGSSTGIRVIPVRFDEWWWSFLPVGPNGVVVLGSVGWVVFLVYAFRLLDERKEREVTR